MYDNSSRVVYNGSTLANLMLFKCCFTLVAEMSKALFVKAMKDLFSDNFMYQFAQLVLEFIDLYFMCRGSREQMYCNVY